MTDDLDELEKAARAARVSPECWLSRWWIAELQALPEEADFIHKCNPDTVLRLIERVRLKEAVIAGLDAEIEGAMDDYERAKKRIAELEAKLARVLDE